MPAQRSLRAVLAILAATFALVVGTVLIPTTASGSTADEQVSINLVNQTRAAAGLPPLTVHPELTRQARAWSSSMAASDQLAHAPNIASGVSAPWIVLGENVGVHAVDDVRQVHDAFVASPGHYQNIVDPRYSYIGVGVVITDNGKLWTTHRFMATAEEPPATTAPPTTASPPTTAAPPTTTAPTTAAPSAAPLVDEFPIAPPTTVAPPTTSRPTTAPSTTSGPATSYPVSSPLGTGAAPQPEATAGPGRADLVTVEQMLIDLIEAGV